MPSKRKQRKSNFDVLDDFPEDPFAGSGRVRYPAPDEPEEDRPKPPPPVWPEVLEVILDERPPGTADDSNERLTSQEIQTMIFNHCGEAPQKAELMGLLKGKGYVYKMTGSGLEWMLRKV